MNKGLLLGAGFSYDLGMSLSAELTEIFLGIFKKRNVKEPLNNPVFVITAKAGIQKNQQYRFLLAQE